jgi:hypothetical protein
VPLGRRNPMRAACFVWQYRDNGSISDPMTAIERKIVTAILGKIRKRREKSASLESESDNHSLVALSAIKLREAQFSDFDAVQELKRRWSLSADSMENWERLWRCNPALLNTSVDRPIGWVLESEGRLVGYLGNISQTYYFGGKTLTAVIGSGFVVEPTYRAVSLSLIAAYYRQKYVDLFLTTTAIETVGKIARAFRSAPLPQQDYDTVLFWVLQPYSFAQVLMKKLRLGPVLTSVGGLAAACAVGADKLLNRRWPRESSASLAISEISVNEIGAEFQVFWAKKLNDGTRLLADRSPAALQWHFQIPGDKGIARVVCCHEKAELVGYAVIRHEPPNQTSGLRRSIIADMLVAEDKPAIVKALLAGAHTSAKQAGSHVLEVLGFPQSIRRMCSEWKPYVRTFPTCPFYYKAADPTLHKTLLDGTTWYASPFDGDTTLWNYGTATQ